MKTTTNCHRCNGLGYLACYSHIDNGRCFSCGGTGRVAVSLDTFLASPAKAAEDAKKAAEDAAAVDDFFAMISA